MFVLGLLLFYISLGFFSTETHMCIAFIRHISYAVLKLQLAIIHGTSLPKAQR